MIDQRITPAWPPEVIEAVRLFRQGHLVERPPFSYVTAATRQVWVVDPGEGAPSDPGAEVWIDLPEDARPPYGLITTQTCDLYEDRRQPKQPWFTVAPVYEASSILGGGQLGHLKKDRIEHLVAMTSAALPAGTWVADLRIEFPVEKGWLVGRAPIESFDDEAGYRRLGERLMHRVNRPAIPNEIVVHIVGPLKSWFEGLGKATAEAVNSVRLLVTGGPFAPETAQLIFIGDPDPIPDGIRGDLDAWWADTSSAAAAVHVQLLANIFATLDDLSARTYSDSDRLDFDYLSLS